MATKEAAKELAKPKVEALSTQGQEKFSRRPNEQGDNRLILDDTRPDPTQISHLESEFYSSQTLDDFLQKTSFKKPTDEDWAQYRDYMKRFPAFEELRDSMSDMLPSNLFPGFGFLRGEEGDEVEFPEEDWNPEPVIEEIDDLDLEKWLSKNVKIGDAELRKEVTDSVGMWAKYVKAEVKQRLADLNVRLGSLIVRVRGLEEENGNLKKLTVSKLFASELEKIKVGYDNSLILVDGHWRTVVKLLIDDNRRLEADIKRLLRQKHQLELEKVSVHALRTEIEELKTQKHEVEVTVQDLQYQVTLLKEENETLAGQKDQFLFLRLKYFNVLAYIQAMEQNYIERIKALESKSQTQIIEILTIIWGQTGVFTMEQTWEYVQQIITQLMYRKTFYERKFYEERQRSSDLEHKFKETETRVKELEAQLRASKYQVDVRDELNTYNELLKSGETRVPYRPVGVLVKPTPAKKPDPTTRPVTLLK